MAIRLGFVLLALLVAWASLPPDTCVVRGRVVGHDDEPIPDVRVAPAFPETILFWSPQEE